MSQFTGASEGSIHDCPVGQFVHVSVFPAEYVPDAHTTGAAETVGQEYPAGHAVQEVWKEVRIFIRIPRKINKQAFHFKTTVKTCKVFLLPLCQILAIFDINDTSITGEKLCQISELKVKYLGTNCRHSLGTCTTIRHVAQITCIQSLSWISHQYLSTRTITDLGDKYPHCFDTVEQEFQ